MSRREPLKVHRVRAGLTQQELADRVGSDQAQISGYETGKIIPSGPRLQDLAKALGCSADEIDLQTAEVA
jgi:transcriptional regulator with XRE-family HTH domain